MAWGGSARRRSGGGRGGGWGLCVAAVAGCGAAGRFRRLGFAARGRAAVAPIAVLALASHALGRGTLRCRAGTRRHWGGGMRGPGSSGRGCRVLGCTRCLRGRGGGASTPGLRCRVSEGLSLSRSLSPRSLARSLGVCVHARMRRCVNEAFRIRNSVASTFHDVVKRTQTTGMTPTLCAWACVCARACVGSTYS